MACASFLKFHPTLPKQGAQVVTRHQDGPIDRRRRELTKEERARQRHSVEVKDYYILLQLYSSPSAVISNHYDNSSNVLKTSSLKTILGKQRRYLPAHSAVYFGIINAVSGQCQR